METQPANSDLQMYGKTLGLIILVSIVLFILTGLPNSVLAGYIHGVIYYYYRKSQRDISLQGQGSQSPEDDNL